MLTCQGCMRHCLQTLLGDAIAIPSRNRYPSVSSISRLRQSRGFATTTTTAFRSGLWDFKEDYREKRSRKDKAKNERFAPSKARERGSGNPKKFQSTIRSREVADNEAFLHLKYLKDPIKLAQFVREKLRDNNLELVQAVVNKASASMPCVVSWNHIIEWHLQVGKMNGALKVYNEMKKRAQVPDAQSYTIIFNGCAKHRDSAQALEKVLTMYQSMLVENAPVKPNTIHLNAILKMCARAGNMEAMFSIVDQMSWKGLTSPNNLTYTTIFNAIRMHITSGRLSVMTPMQKRMYDQKQILHARHMWADVVKAWRQGNIWIDEELVCSMGRLLAVGNEQDQDDILSLVEQTMNIPRLMPRIGTSERSRSEPGDQGRKLTQVEAPVVEAVSNDAEPRDADAEVDGPPEPIVPVVFAPGVATTVSGVYATPTQNTLSLVIQSFGYLQHLKDVAHKYWILLTDKYNIVPDAENYHAYLRILRLSRASTESVNLVRTMPKFYLESKTFRIAMSSCVRDIKNLHAFANAGKLLDLMQSSLKEPEIQVLQSYLDVAITSTASAQRNTPGSQETTKYEQGNQIRRALERLEPSFINLKSALAFRDPTLPKITEHEHQAFLQNILGLTKRMISAYDILVNNKLVPKEEHSMLINDRNKLSAFISRHTYIRLRDARNEVRKEYREAEAEAEEQNEEERVPFTISRGSQRMQSSL